MEFHIRQWNSDLGGGWSLYRISAEQICQSVGYDKAGRVNRRDGWPGYIGTFPTLAELSAAIEKESSK